MEERKKWRWSERLVKIVIFVLSAQLFIVLISDWDAWSKTLPLPALARLPDCHHSHSMGRNNPVLWSLINKC